MSLAVWSLALLHGFFVLIVAEFTHSKGAIVIAAIAAATIGVLTGDPIYIAIDLCCVAVATYFCWTSFEDREQLSNQELAAAKEKDRIDRLKADQAQDKLDKTINGLFQVVAVVVALFILWAWTRQPAPPPLKNAVQSQTATAPMRDATSAPAADKTHNDLSQGTDKGRKKRATSIERTSVEECLQIPDEKSMARCLERAR